MTKQTGDKTRNDLTGEHRWGDAGQAIIALLFTVAWVLDTFFLNYTTFLNDTLSPAVRNPLAFFLLLISGYLAWAGLKIVFGEKRDVAVVIRKGVFAVIRHPVYLSEILLYLGILMLSLSLAAAVIWVIVIAFLHFISRHEEKLLLARFGEDYARYMREVPMWLPRLRKK